MKGTLANAMPAKIASLLFATLITFATSCGAALLDREVEISEADIQRSLVKSGPQQRNYGGLMTVALLDPPIVTLGIPEGRVGITARVDIAVLGNRPVPVNFTGTAGIRYDDSAKAFFLENPVAHTVESRAIPREAEPQARQAVNTLISNYFRTKPIYVLRQNGSVEEIAARWLLRSIRIEAGKVVAILSPI
ncbi:MAG TPA: DUF1439 domain-containing protein [Azonexus sp.]|nr:DUF1439 domain-containing protein [Azonexus sp.]